MGLNYPKLRRTTAMLDVTIIRAGIADDYIICPEN
jgi:hypothetical protein